MFHQHGKRRIARTLLSLVVIVWVCSSCGGGSGDTAPPPAQAQVAATPAFAVPAGTYSANQSVAIGCATPGAAIHYTTDGSTPTTASAVYADPIPVAGNGTTVTIRAMAVKAGMLNSAIVSATYTINTNVAGVLISRPASTAGGLVLSSWVSPNGSSTDFYAYDDFTLPSTAAITEVRWRGGYASDGAYGPASDFTITFFASNATGTEPLVSPPDPSETFLAQYRVGSDVSTTFVGKAGLDNVMYDYRYQLPTPFPAIGGTKYWLRIEAFQPVYPDWGIAAGTGGDGVHFWYDTGTKTFRFAPNDTSFTLVGN